MSKEEPDRHQLPELPAFVRGQPVWVDGRPAVFREMYRGNAAIVWYPGDHTPRIVPKNKLQLNQPG